MRSDEPLSKGGESRDYLRAIEDALRACQTRYRAVVENIPDYGIVLLNAKGYISEWTPGAKQLTGCGAEEMIGQHASVLYTPEANKAGDAEKDLEEAMRDGRTERDGWRIRKNGERFYVSEITIAVRNSAGDLTGFTRVFRDMSERRRSDAAVERKRIDTDRILSGRRVIEAEEGERRRISRDLHDELGQHITAIGLGLQGISDVAIANSEVDRRARQLREMADRMGRDMHALAIRLRPRTLDDFGLESAINAFISHWQEKTGIDFQLHISSNIGRLSSEIESTIYRIVQEALTNVARHSKATSGSVHLDRRDETLTLVIEDNGEGFQSGWKTPDPERGLGLRGISERAALLDGTLEVESSGKGATLFVRIPLADNMDEKSE